MMFTKAFALLALPFLAAATPLEKRGGGPTCNSGSVSCCNQYHASNSPTAQHFGGLLGITGQAMNDFSVAVQCNPVTGIGLSQSGCKQRTLCCDGNNISNTLFNFQCIPITVG
ncbi:hypothetical protein CPB83DRAFT_222394 [Crepidotus variabilis]|uniref:Hydrophobin n=1 Tax=Crepidotus variabilis TaxID=179855 RepID=A0A9P6JV17_9AGAR|nr:hypothetical protein CPB83DRAFT_222394 [Crepidotus variabilis]